jgi:formate C-acetyltransferase
MDLSPRVRRLRHRLLASRPELCVERARIVTEVYRDTEGDPTIVRRAKALQAVLQGMTIRIDDGELIVGNQASRLRSAPIFPEFSHDWIEAELDSFAGRTGDPFLVSEEAKTALREILPDWRGRSTKDLALEKLSPRARDAQSRLALLLTSLSSGLGHVAPDYGRVLRLGLEGLVRRAEGERARLSAGDGRAAFYEAAIVAMRAVMDFAARFADLARRLAAGEADPFRRRELETIADVCDRVPARPARSFHEALQSFWFVHLAIQLESNGHSISPGRFDQYMLRPYRDGMATKTLTREIALELLQCLWIKLNEVNKVRDGVSSLAFGGYPMFQNLVVGGLTAEGEDATNELSYLCMEATAATRLPQPSFSVRIHSNTPEPFLRQACELSKLGTGMPAFFNDEAVVQVMQRMGYGPEEARDYAEVGCVEPQCAGTTNGYYPGGFVSLPKCLELALNGGRDPQSGVALGPAAPAPETFNSIAEVTAAFHTQLGHLVELLAQADNAIELVHAEVAPSPFVSVLVDDCLSRGLAFEAGGARYNFTSPNAVGLANVADSLAAIETLVFREKRISMAELVGATRCDFEGCEDTRRLLLNRAPKYGNDDHRADEFAREVADIFFTEVLKHKNARGGRFQPGLQSISAHALFAGSIGATPDGRKREMLVADGGVSPAQGRDRSGPTAVIRSVARLDHLEARNGALLNLRFDPRSVRGEQGTRNLAALVRSFFDLGGQHVQFSVVGADALRDAQENPENHRGLLVRVAGFSVFFTSIDRTLQDDIIARTAHRFE